MTPNIVYLSGDVNPIPLDPGERRSMVPKSRMISSDSSPAELSIIRAEISRIVKNRTRTAA